MLFFFYLIFNELHLQTPVRKGIDGKSSEQYGDNRIHNYYDTDYSAEDLTNEKRIVGEYSDVYRSNYTKITYSTFPDKYHR